MTFVQFTSMVDLDAWTESSVQLYNSYSMTFPCVLVGQHGSAWHTAEAEVSTAYRAFSKEKVMADLGINIGLNAVNVSLRALPVHNQSSSIDYNERFYWIGSSQMKHEYHNALVKVRILEIFFVNFW
jgi:hypothetical protein